MYEKIEKVPKMPHLSGKDGKALLRENPAAEKEKLYGELLKEKVSRGASWGIQC